MFDKLSGWKRHLASALTTFLAGAFMAMLPEWDSLTLESFENGALLGLSFAGIRAGFKAVIELFLMWYSTRKD